VIRSKPGDGQKQFVHGVETSGARVDLLAESADRRVEEVEMAKDPLSGDGMV
jgi:hypothetical protein